jgi:photosystem II stability/assembly factor-like uncharacterized protein
MVFETDAPADEILVGTVNGVAWLRRAGRGEPWRETLRALPGKHISNLVEDPETGRLFAGVHGEGIHASDDGGRTWQRKDQGVAHQNIYSMSAVRAADGVRLYAGTEPAHLFVSRDHGESWQELPALRSVPTVDTWMFPAPPHVAHVKHIQFDPRAADTIYASVEVGGAMKSTDGGQTWRQLSGFFEDVHRMMVTAARPDRLVMANGAGVYRSSDAGETWEQLTDRSARIGYPDTVIIHPQRPDTVFLAGAICGPGQWRETKTADARVARSRDGGTHWEYLEGGLPAHIHGNIEGMALHTWPGGVELFAGTTDGDVFFSADEGDTWVTIARAIGPVSKGGHHLALPLDGALVETAAD